ncbi:MAG: branched-chain amino acid aminotransferase/4-amino-4-deoxychorismate lyase [Gammaproteobacteria bacterium]|nr:branched-chain amino acid aminotransferase/4-amino-4-deoxychorismate lyase [Gammaproteobacteria bacterium]
MSGPLPLCYLNGNYLPLEQATVSPLDRAFLFGDAVYEVVPVYASRPFRLRQHLDRLNRSLDAIRMPPPMTHGDWAHVCQELISQNSAFDATLYMQVTRGAEFGRNHAWPEGLKPTLFAYCTELDPLPAALLDSGVAAITAQEIRWERRDIKATALLANILLKKLAADAGAFETIMLEQGELTEGSSTTVHVVTNGIIHTPPNGHHILPGTTRDAVIELADLLSIHSISAPISEAALRGADEIWLAFSTRGVLPVTKLDGAAVGRGTPGPLFKRMNIAFVNYIRELGKTPAL